MLSPAAYNLLYDNIHDFKTAALHVEEEIARHGIRHDRDDAVPGMGDRTHRDMWISMKTVSHFNIGIALELMLKLLLYGDRKKPPNTHSLKNLYLELPDRFQIHMDSLYSEVFSQYFVGFELIAFGHTASGTRPPSDLLTERNMRCLEGLFDYFDQDIIVWQKRYSWEMIGEEKWLHYISDIKLVIDFINRVMRTVSR